MSVKRLIYDIDKLSIPCDSENTVYKPSDHRVINDLMDTIDELKLISLSAPQIGYNTRIFVMIYDSTLLMVINPKVIKMKEPKTFLIENCISKPGTNAKIIRYNEITIRSYNDLNGVVIERKFTGVHARVVQHQIDHLNGVLI